MVQSTARPLGLSIVNPVEAGSSDEAAKNFRSGELAQIAKLVSQTPAADNFVEHSTIKLDPSKLRLTVDSDVRAYFVAKDTDLANSLGFTTDGSGKANSSTAKLLFPNASTAAVGGSGNSGVKRTAAEPLLPGDFVRMGNLAGGTKLDFFLLADGARAGTTSLSSKSSANASGVGSMLSYAYKLKDSPYLLLAFDDFSSSNDRNFSDLVVALDIGAINTAALTATPEPSTCLSMGAFLGIGTLLILKGRRTNA